LTDFLPEVLFARPWVLPALLGIPVYWILRGRLLRHEAVPFAPLQYRAGWSRWRDRLRRPLALQRAPLEGLLLAALLVGLAGPYTEDSVELLDDEGIDVTLVLDVSLSMLAEDFPPDRLTALRRIARDFIARSGSNRIGVVIFAKDAFVQAPLTTDHTALFSLLEGVTVYTIDQGRSGGTAIGDALLYAAQGLLAARQEERDQAIVLITDGESNEGIEPALAAKFLRRSEIFFYAVGIGGLEPIPVYFEGENVGDGDTTYEAYLDDAQLKELAEITGGRYYRALDVDALEAIFQDLSRLQSAPLESRLLTVQQPLGEFFALASLLLFALLLGLEGIFVRRPLR
jgi:Ca-activated chloride channel family protein